MEAERDYNKVGSKGLDRLTSAVQRRAPPRPRPPRSDGPSAARSPAGLALWCRGSFLVHRSVPDPLGRSAQGPARTPVQPWPRPRGDLSMAGCEVEHRGRRHKAVDTSRAATLQRPSQPRQSGRAGGHCCLPLASPALPSPCWARLGLTHACVCHPERHSVPGL